MFGTKYSIIIATLNVEKAINKTLDSIYSQTYSNYEIIVIDGQSTDSTIAILDDYKKRFGKMIYISEADTGIYNAMNKGIQLITGDYCTFLGAGDLLFDENVLLKLNKLINTNDDLLIGSVVTEDGICNTKADINYLLKRHAICHQQIWAKSSLLKEYPFDENYKIAADQDWIMRMLKKRVTIKYCNDNMCLYDISGVSNSGETRKLGIEEFRLIQKKHFYVMYCFRELCLFLKGIVNC